MRLTPLDIQNHHFALRWRGCDAEEVKTFLRLVADDYASLLRETEGLREKMRSLEERVASSAGEEQTLRQTLMIAQGLAEDLKRTAMKEAEVLVGEAEVKSEKILDAAHRRAAKLAEDIREMKQLRIRLASAVRSTIETHLTLLEGLAEELPEDPLLDGKVTYLARSVTFRASGGSSGGA